MHIESEEPQIWLQEEFKTRKRNNRSYSLRAFAQKLDISPGRLSELFSGKRNMTRKVAERVASRLEYTPEEREHFLKLIELRHKKKMDAKKKKILINNDFKQLPSDSFYVISDWYHFAILSLIELEDFDSSPKWIAKRLGISLIEAKSALDRLVRLKLIEADEKGRWIKCHDNLTTTHDLESIALKRSHKQSLRQSIDAIDEVPVEWRDITSITMSIDTKKLPEAKEMIKNFRRELCAFLELDEKKNEVYNLNIQFIPITKKLNQRRKK